MQNTSANLKAKKAGVGGLKMLIVAGSLAITLGGWGKLAADQLQAAAPAQTAFVQSGASNTQQQVNQLATAQVSSATRAVARTRSSR